MTAQKLATIMLFLVLVALAVISVILLLTGGDGLP